MLSKVATRNDTTAHFWKRLSRTFKEARAAGQVYSTTEEFPRGHTFTVDVPWLRYEQWEAIFAEADRIGIGGAFAHVFRTALTADKEQGLTALEFARRYEERVLMEELRKRAKAEEERRDKIAERERQDAQRRQVKRTQRRQVEDDLFDR